MKLGFFLIQNNILCIFSLKDHAKWGVTSTETLTIDKIICLKDPAKWGVILTQDKLLRADQLILALCVAHGFGEEGSLLGDVPIKAV